MKQNSLPHSERYDDAIGAQHYATQLGTYDEMYATQNKPLPHWEQFMTVLGKMGGEELERRRREAQRLLRNNGVTYNVYVESQSLVRPWQLDPIPLLISNQEWTTIAAGLEQRAELLNLLLNDIYGEQRLLKKGLLPIELIYGHHGFLRPCVGAFDELQRQLTLYSADLARGPDGRMWVLDDRTQAPSGTGYALENRTVMTRVLPDLFHEAHVHRLSMFFRALRSALERLAPHNKEAPRIVVLTPGALNETYFEHAYLASYLGYTLVQGDDLTVRDGRVWIKSLQGLNQVDVILRRVDDFFCDPLELRAGSKLGVTGLLEATRRGNVTVANPLGSSVLENNGLLPFLPGLARYFLGSELLLPSVATWWCGQRREREFVVHNLERLVIKKINRSPGRQAILGALLSQREKAELRDEIRAKPYLFIGQEQVGFSTVPAFVNGHIEPRHAILRSFVVANQKGYQAMPGGLTRIAADKDTVIVSNQSGGLSKDTWVMAEAPEQEVSLWLKPQRDQLVEPTAEPLPSRAADNLYWVGRHLERIEFSARLLRIVLQKLFENTDFDDSGGQCLHVLLGALTQVTATYPGFVGDASRLLKAPEQELLSIACNGSRPGTLPSSLKAFNLSALNVRDLWSQDTWLCIDDIQQRWQSKVIAADITLEQLQEHLNELIAGVVAFTGLISESMTRESGWMMLDSGRRLERALLLMAFLRSTVVLRHDEYIQNQILESVLNATDSLSIYQRRYRSYIQLPMVLELLLLDESHPRSLVYQLQQLYGHITTLPRGKKHKGRLSSVERIVFKAFTDIRLVKPQELSVAHEEDGIYANLEGLLSTNTELLWQASDKIAEAYFNHAQKAQQLAPTRQEDEL
ncbi:MAG: circularly permuted type 2 ATP-grasp protein [Gammaproteobacteria bacterium]